MHGATQVTPEVGIVLAIGLAIFVIVYRWIFKKPGR